MRIEEFRGHHFKEKIREGKNHAVLLFEGKKARKNLREMYEDLSKGYETNWVENPKDERDFWIEVSKGINITIENLSKNFSRLSSKVEACLIDHKTAHYLFLPEIEKSFFKFGRINSKLRSIFQKPESCLSIYASVLKENSEEYKTTLGEYNFPFYVGCFINIDC